MSVVVTGSSRGLGLALVKHIATIDSIHTVFATARATETPTALQDTIRISNGKIVYISLDVDSGESINSATTSIEQSLSSRHGGDDKGGLDILINNAGIQFPEPDGITAMNQLDQVLNTNVVAVHNVTAALSPLLRKGTQKKIVNVSSTLGSIGMADTFSFCDVYSYKISKAALNMLTMQYALTLGKREGFTVFALSPGSLRTNLGGGSGDWGHLTADEGARRVWDVIEGASHERDNGVFRNIHVEGNADYDGNNPPW